MFDVENHSPPPFFKDNVLLEQQETKHVETMILAKN